MCPGALISRTSDVSPARRSVEKRHGPLSVRGHRIRISLKRLYGFLDRVPSITKGMKYQRRPSPAYWFNAAVFSER